MRYFLDTEFNGFGGELISIGVVSEDDSSPPFYEAVECANPTTWVNANVVPALQTRPRPLREVAREFAEYLQHDPEPIIIADWPEDIAHAARLLTDDRAGRLLASGVRFDLLAASSFSSEARSQVPHNAYYDALALRDWVLAGEAS